MQCWYNRAVSAAAVTAVFGAGISLSHAIVGAIAADAAPSVLSP
jgi:hypothetical protein